MSNVTELEVVTEEAPQQSAEEPPHRQRAHRARRLASRPDLGRRAQRAMD